MRKVWSIKLCPNSSESFPNPFGNLFDFDCIKIDVVAAVEAHKKITLALYSIKEKIFKYISETVLKLKLILVSILIIVAAISIPIISLPGDDFYGINLKYLKHALEWDYFIGVISFYLLTFLMWKKN